MNMEDRARDMRLVPLPGDGSDSGHERRRPGFTAEDLDVARDLAEYHRVLASELEPSSELRGLVLRCAGHWSRLGAIPRNGLSGVEPGDRE
jgi:hypothetical protein